MNCQCGDANSVENGSERNVPRVLQIVCISDTHSRHNQMKDVIPHGDILLHAGDFTMRGKVKEIQLFNEFLGTLPHKHKIVISGNHDVSMDVDYVASKRNCRIPLPNWKEGLSVAGVDHPDQLITNAIYLKDSGVDIHGLRIWGSPWCPEFCNWAFMKPRGRQLAEKWKMIPADIDVLMTHSPPAGIHDRTVHGTRAGCEELVKEIQRRIKPQVSIFGHIHEDAGRTTIGNTTFVNAAICNIAGYIPCQPPHVVHVTVDGDRWRDGEPQLFGARTTQTQSVTGLISRVLTLK